MSVFVSYSSADLEFARALVGEIEARGYDVWWDQDDMAGGDAWRGQLADAIRGCEAFVLVLSPSSMSSRNVINEVTAALDYERRVIPVVHQPCRLHRDIEIDVRGLHRIDCASQPFSQGVARLIESLGGGATVQVDPREAVDRGVLLAKQGRPQEAEEAYRQAIASGDATSAPTAEVYLGILLQEQGRPAEAEAAFRQAIASGQVDWAPTAMVSLGILLKEQGRSEEAEAAYLRAIASGHATWAAAAGTGPASGGRGGLSAGDGLGPGQLGPDGGGLPRPPAEGAGPGAGGRGGVSTGDGLGPRRVGPAGGRRARAPPDGRVTIDGRAVEGVRPRPRATR
jgi:tetratricopeptide (TPR) repeat protein